MNVVQSTEYDFCNICHLIGMEQAVEVKMVLIEETPTVHICKECAEKIGAKAKEIKDDHI